MDDITAPLQNSYFSTEALEVHLTCSICHSLMLKVLQCYEGHTLCSTCHGSLPAPKKCPTCRVPFPTFEIRNTLVERIFKEHVILCSLCRIVKLPMKAMTDHQINCQRPWLLCRHCDLFETQDPLELLRHLHEQVQVYPP